MGAKSKASRSAESRRVGGDAQSQESIRVRARRRLIGAVVLVLTGVVVFPLVFRSPPQPLPAQVALDMPSPERAASLPMPSVGVSSASAAAAAASTPGEKPAAAAPVPATPAPSARAGSAPAAAVAAAPAAPAPKPVAAPSQAAARPNTPPPAARPAQPQPAPAVAAAPAKPAAEAKAPPPKGVNSARAALAALEGKQPDQISEAQALAAMGKSATPEDAAPAKDRFVVQAGAYADSHTAQQVRAKIAKLGLPTYTQVVDTAQGKRIRVRVGPFTSREAADKALAQVRQLGVNAAVLTL